MRVPTVSVVIPTLGNWSLLERAVASSRAQTEVDVQVVVALDGEAVRDWRSHDFLVGDDVVVLPSADRRGVAGARNAGLEAADGEWVALLDDDDLWAPDKLLRQLAAAAEADADWVYSSALQVDDQLTPVTVDVAPPVEDLQSNMLTHNPIPACASNILCRTALAREIAFDPALKHFADWDFAVRLIDAAPAARVRDVLVGYVLHDESMHVAGLSGVDAEFRYLRDRHGREGRQLGSVAVTRWIAAGQRAAGHRGRAAIAYMRGALRYRSPADVTRAVAALMGERVMRLGRPRRPAPAPAPEWLSRAV